MIGNESDRGNVEKGWNLGVKMNMTWCHQVLDDMTEGNEIENPHPRT